MNKIKQYENDTNDALDDDLPGNNTRYNQKHRNDVVLNYDSDSSVEDYNKDEKEVAKANEEIDESDDDMFASDKDEKNLKDDVEDAGLSKDLNRVDSFDKDDFDGPVDENYKLGSVYDNDGDNSDDNENGESNQSKIDYYTNIENIENARPGNKKKLAPKIEAFDLTQEAEDGTFDKDGNFIRNKEEENQQQDEWLNLKKGEIEKAKAAQLERNRLNKERRMQADNNTMPIQELLSDLINLLESVETPMEALARFSPKKVPRSKKTNGPTNYNDQERKKTVILITDLCEKLANKKGISNAYELTKEEFMRIYKVETGSDYNQIHRGKKRTRDDTEEDVLDYGEKNWEFRWNGQEEVHGPYSEYEMRHWSEIYFENNVVVRKIGESGFIPIHEVNFN